MPTEKTTPSGIELFDNLTNNSLELASFKETMKKASAELLVAKRLGLENTEKGWTKKKNADSLKIYTDRALYTDSDSEILVTVENPSDKAEVIDITTYFPSDSKVHIDRIYVKEAGLWTEISSSEKENSQKSWNNKKKYDKIPKNHISTTPLIGYNIPANSEVYFKIIYNTYMHDIFTEEFYIEVFGDKGGYGSLDPEISQTEGWWRDNFTDKTGIDEKNCISVGSGDVKITQTEILRPIAEGSETNIESTAGCTSHWEC
ncbi:MAG: hypothetical protein KAT91_03355, partial [Candidatus Aenigmarchaeota archaeon]|nr:hypothetical protein [Candidatus Aenigmarchaeota archaeon]